MDFSLMTEPQLGGTYDQLLTAARYAESVGCVSFARADHYYSSREPTPAATDALATLAGLSRDTTTIGLAVLVTPVTFRHPAVIAKNAASIHEMSGGRFALGLGTGWMEAEHEAFGLRLPDMSERFARFEEALHYLEAAFVGSGTYSGQYYQLDANVYPKPAGMPIIIGGSGPTRTPTLAGRHANEYNHFVAPPDVITPKIEVMRDAASAHGRDPSDIVVSTVGPAFVGRTQAEYRDRIEAEAATRDITVEELEERAERSNIPHGTAAQAQEALSAMESAGASKYYLQWFDLDDQAGIETSLEVLLS